ncbi:cyanate transporter [Paraburkholderia tagetis]|uniref:Cyanate transporter n=1 Tax=Paraburkholderia tagetis TaxID=2913261 RepID=A0A9X1RP53_9BURK|nr:cyanate transporter [Paraburkholderia tagetis]MCG5072678.1 cyanate transporter [Paraburkholderia tagetis]
MSNSSTSNTACSHAVRASAGALAMLVLVGLNLRPFLTSVGPVLDLLRHDTGLTFRSAALLTTLPFLLMGVIGWFGFGLAGRFGERRSLAFALSLLALGCALRGWVSSGTSLIVSAGIAGTGVAAIQALMPGITKHWFPHRVPVAMGLYSASLVGGGAIGAVASPWLAAHAGWHFALAIWAVPAFGMLALWLARAPHDTAAVAGKPPSVARFVRNRRAWELAIFFGLTNSGFSSLVTWLPSFYRQLGTSPQASGNLLAWMALCQATSAFVMPMLARRSDDRRQILWLTMGLQGLGFAGLAIVPGFSPSLWVACAGFGLGGFFSLSLIVTLDHLHDARHAGALAAFVQGVGFLVAAGGPWLVGWLRDAGASFTTAWLMHLAIVFMMAGLTAVFAPTSYRSSMKGMGVVVRN